MKIDKLDWDSAFFNLRIGKLVKQENETFSKELLIFFSKEFDLIYVFSQDSIDDLSLVDQKVVFLLENIKDIEQEFDDTISFSLKEHSYDELLNLTLQSGIYSRFKTDSNFKNNEYERLYTEWIDKSINKELAIDVIIELVDNKIVGFTTLNKKTENLCDIGLVAVDENFRGRGIAKNLINKTIFRAKKLGFKSIQVVTQANNIPAVKLYLSSGFKLNTNTNIYHYWNL